MVFAIYKPQELETFLHLEEPQYETKEVAINNKLLPVQNQVSFRESQLGRQCNESKSLGWRMWQDLQR